MSKKNAVKKPKESSSGFICTQNFHVKGGYSAKIGEAYDMEIGADRLKEFQALGFLVPASEYEEKSFEILDMKSELKEMKEAQVSLAADIHNLEKSIKLKELNLESEIKSSKSKAKKESKSDTSDLEAETQAALEEELASDEE